MDVEVKFLSSDGEIIHRLRDLAKQCESWWVCVGGPAAGIGSPLWQIITERKECYLDKLDYAVVGLISRFWNVRALKTLHEAGKLRVVVASEGAFEPHVYAFRMRDHYAALVVNCVTVPSLFGSSIASAVLSICPGAHRFELSLEAFLSRCVKMSRTPASMDFDSLEGFDSVYHIADAVVGSSTAPVIPVKARIQVLEPPGPDQVRGDGLGICDRMYERQHLGGSGDNGLPSVLVPLVERSEIRGAYERFYDRIHGTVQPVTRTVGFQGDSFELEVYWHPEQHIWSHFEEPDWAERYWCIFGTDDVNTNESLSITCEINPPYEGINRRVAGVFAGDEGGDVYVTHSGKIGGGREGVGKVQFLLFCGDDRLVELSRPDGESSEAILIGRLDDVHLIEDIASFVYQVQRFKDLMTGNY